MAAPPQPSRVPRWARIACYPVAAVLLTAFFVFLGFPYDLLALRISDELERNLDVRVRIGELSPHLGLFGPGIEASEVLASREGQPSFVVQELVLRPAWSLAWLRGNPAVHLDVVSDLGSGSGTVVLGDRGGFEGTLDAVRLEQLPLESLAALDLHGSLGATIDLRRAGIDVGGGYEGFVDFDVREGSLRSEGLPLALPFDRLFGRLDFGGESYAKVSGVQLEGPLLAGTIEGEVGHGPAPGREPLALDVAFEVRDPGLAGMFTSLGRPGSDGRRRLSVTGTLSRPMVR